MANALIHADYKFSRGVVIEKGKTYFKFSNPGSLRITREEALRGGISDPRNENIFKMFNLLGVGERAGSGLENIQLAWKEQEWIAPDLEESYDPDRITLTLRTMSMLPEESITLLKSVLKSKYDELNKNEVMTLVTAHQEEYVSNNRLQQLLDIHALEGNKILSSLVDKGYLESDGVGKGTKYYLINILGIDIKKVGIENKENFNVIFTAEEQLIIDYISKYKLITNALARTELGFSKTTVSRLFNKLIIKEIIIRIGSGSQVKYVFKGEE